MIPLELGTDIHQTSMTICEKSSDARQTFRSLPWKALTLGRTTLTSKSHQAHKKSARLQDPGLRLGKAALLQSQVLAWCCATHGRDPESVARHSSSDKLPNRLCSVFEQESRCDNSILPRAGHWSAAQSLSIDSMSWQHVLME